MSRLAVVTRGVAAVETLPALLGEHDLVTGRGRASRTADAVLAWGRKSSAAVAQRFAARHGLPLHRLEDGFLRSVGLGGDAPPLSIVLDDLGIYYDASAPSRLEALIASARGAPALARARQLMLQWRELRLSKYNHARDAAPPIAGPYVLVVDQTRGDASIAHGLADEQAFSRMLEAALQEHPELPVLLKVHPDVIAGRKQGHFAALTPAQAVRVHVCAAPLHPAGLLEGAAAVYVVTSQLGFEALMWGRPVHTFGMPFYAGWGLTTDALPAPQRRRGAAPSLEALVHAALVDYPRYLDPETGRRCEVERLMAWIGLQRRMRQRLPAEVWAVGYSRWKKPIVRRFLAGSQVRFARSTREVPPGASLAVWGCRDVSCVTTRPKSPPATVLRLEDGFLRSVGLGADLVRPLSWVVDATGLYYDATAPSDLEQLLATTDFSPALLERARALRARILVEEVTKYNVGRGTWTRPADAARVILVPGQVESDASIALGAPGLRGNIALLRAVRAAAPDAHIVYKPHPDVVARLRRAGAAEETAALHCDEIVVDVPMGSLLDAVDEVHVLTSLAGFEALLRGRRVVTHGCPFYAGWGLTEDRIAQPRRTRRVSLDELTAAALILYPAYVSATTGHYTTPERALDEIAAWRRAGPATMPLPRRLLRSVLGWVKGH